MDVFISRLPLDYYFDELVVTDDKSNESTAIPKLLHPLMIEDCIVPINAAG